MRDCGNTLTEKVIGAAIQVHRELGPGLLESVYELALLHELHNLSLHVKRQVEIPVIYRGTSLGTGFKADLIIEDRLLIELKSVDKFDLIHIAQVITYLKLTNIKRGLLFNFNTTQLKYGIKRISI